jgi:hypothetical protein
VRLMPMLLSARTTKPSPTRSNYLSGVLRRGQHRFPDAAWHDSMGVARTAREANVPVVMFAGRIALPGGSAGGSWERVRRFRWSGPGSVGGRVAPWS